MMDRVKKNEFERVSGVVVPKKKIETHPIDNKMIYKKKARVEVDNLRNAKEGKLVANKKETVQLKREVKESGYGKLSNYLIRNKSGVLSCHTPDLYRDNSANSIHSVNGVNGVNGVNSVNAVKVANNNAQSSPIKKNKEPQVFNRQVSPFNIKYPGANSASKNVSTISHTRNHYNVNECLSSIKRSRRTSDVPLSFNNNINQNQNQDENFNNYDEDKNYRRQIEQAQQRLDEQNERLFYNNYERVHKDGLNDGVNDGVNDGLNYEVDTSLLSLNYDLTHGKGGRVEFVTSPAVKAKTTANHYHGFKIIFIQSNWRGYSLRCKLYRILYRYYTGMAFAKHMKNLKKYIGFNFFSRFFDNLKILTKPNIPEVIVSLVTTKQAITIQCKEEEFIITSKVKTNYISKDNLTIDDIPFNLKEQLINEYIKNKLNLSEINYIDTFTLDQEFIKTKENNNNNNNNEVLPIKQNFNEVLPIKQNVEKSFDKTKMSEKKMSLLLKLHDDKIIEFEHLEEVLKPYNNENTQYASEKLKKNDTINSQSDWKEEKAFSTNRSRETLKDTSKIKEALEDKLSKLN